MGTYPSLCSALECFHLVRSIHFHWKKHRCYFSASTTCFVSRRTARSSQWLRQWIQGQEEESEDNPTQGKQQRICHSSFHSDCLLRLQNQNIVPIDSCPAFHPIGEMPQANSSAVLFEGRNLPSTRFSTWLHSARVGRAPERRFEPSSPESQEPSSSQGPVPLRQQPMCEQ